LRRNEAEMASYREAHPWKARLHDFHVVPDNELKTRQEAEASLKAERGKLEKAFEKSQRENMKAVQGLGDAKSQAMPEALRLHEPQVEYFRDVESICQPLKEREIAREEACRQEQELARQHRNGKRSVSKDESEGGILEGIWGG
jgi:hypothetical protein